MNSWSEVVDDPKYVHFGLGYVCMLRNPLHAIVHDSCTHLKGLKGKAFSKIWNGRRIYSRVSWEVPQRGSYEASSKLKGPHPYS